MFKALRRILRGGRRARGRSPRNGDLGRDIPDELSRRLDDNLRSIQASLEGYFDLLVRPVTLPIRPRRRAVLVSLEGMADEARINENILEPLLRSGRRAGVRPARILDHLVDEVIEYRNVRKSRAVGDLLQAVEYGESVLLVDGVAEALILDTKGYQVRCISTVEREVSIRGPLEAFVEDIRTSVAQLRRKIHTSRFKMTKLVVGSETRTVLVFCYIEGVCSPELIAEVEQRLRAIDARGVLDVSHIEEYIEDVPWSPFPQIKFSERADVIASGLLEGRVAILMDGATDALLVPSTLWNLMEAPDDHYQRFVVSSFLKLVRYLFATLAVFLPGAYIAAVNYHHSMIPTPLIMSIAQMRAGIPFPAIIEILLLDFTFEALREAGLRLPTPVGTAVNIVGALVLGLAVVQAGFVSTPAIIIVATAGVASFLIPSFSLALTVRILRFLVLAFSAVSGLFGVAVALLLIVIHLVSLSSFGVPYLAPIAPLVPYKAVRSLIRAPRRPPGHLHGTDEEEIPR